MKTLVAFCGFLGRKSWGLDTKAESTGMWRAVLEPGPRPWFRLLTDHGEEMNSTAWKTYVVGGVVYPQ